MRRERILYLRGVYPVRRDNWRLRAYLHAILGLVRRSFAEDFAGKTVSTIFPAVRYFHRDQAVVAMLPAWLPTKVTPCFAAWVAAFRRASAATVVMSTKQARRWLFTLNNFTTEEVDSINSWHQDGRVKFLIYQHESGANSTPHLQGYIVGNGPLRLRAVRSLLARGHWEAARGTHMQCVEYCSKGETRVDGPWQFGEHGVQGERSDLQRAADMLRGGATLRAVAQEFPGQFIRYGRGMQQFQSVVGGGGQRDVHVLAYFGEPGSGKTSRVYEETAWRHVHRGGNCREPYRPVVTKAQLWWEGYDGEDTVLLDDWVGTGSISGFLQLLDRYPIRVNVKGASAHAKFTYLYITSNLLPSQWWEGGLSDIHRKAIERRFTRVEYIGEVQRYFY